MVIDDDSATLNSVLGSGALLLHLQLKRGHPCVSHEGVGAPLHIVPGGEGQVKTEE